MEDKDKKKRLCDACTYITINKSNHESIQDDKISNLERLAKLKENGILTGEEFLEEKKKILEG